MEKLLRNLVYSLDRWKKIIYTKRMALKITTENYPKVTERIRMQRDKEIRDYYQQYKDDPGTGWTIEKLATVYGISKQRVWQIVSEEVKEG